MWIRLSAGVLFVLGGMFCGFSFSDRLKRNVTFCLSAEKLLNVCEFSIRANNDDVYGIIRRIKAERLKGFELFGSFPECYSPDSDFHEQWREAVLAERNINKEERELMLYLGELLGSTDTEGQLRCINDIRSELHCVHEKRRAEYYQKGKLYRSIGLLMGVTIGIIII